MSEATKLLRTIRLDASDTFAFEKAAEPGEWAVPGSFAFWDEDLAAVKGKRRIAFRSGWLGIDTGGWSTLAVVVQATQPERDDAVRQLAELLVAQHGAPDMGTALAAADEEVRFAESCAQHPEQTLVIIHRSLSDSGDIREQFRTVKAGLPFNKDNMSRVFTFHEVEGEEDQAIEERVDLATLAEAKRQT
ncbi:MAG: DUF6505 family protein [Beijerinckiaceae bacterium]